MLLWDAVSPADLTRFARELPNPQELTLNQVLPDRVINGVKARTVKTTRTLVAATFRNYDAETPIGYRPITTTLTDVNLPPIGQKIPLTEGDIVQQAFAGGDLSDVVDAIYDDTEHNVRAIRARLEFARGQFLTTGKFTLTAENGLTLEADYGLPAPHTAAPAILWSNTVTAVPLTNERAWADLIRTDGGNVSFAVTSSAVLALMQANTQYKTSYFGSATDRPDLNLDQLNSVRAGYGLPPISVNDNRANVGAVSTRFIGEDYFILGGNNLGETQFGTTADALELAGSNAVDFTRQDAPGIFAAAYKSTDPVTRWSKATAVAMPVAGEINSLFVSDVK